MAGPTAVGKTAIAIQLAKYFSAEIISADSRQCYRELNIGVAKPTLQQLQQVRHHFINSHSIHQDFSAVDFEEYALNAASEIFSKNDIAVMVGGTGLYIKAFAQGLDAIPSIDKTIRSSLIQTLVAEGIEVLQEKVKIQDPGFYASGEIQNPQRLIRALEVITTGRSVFSYQSGAKKQRSFNIIKIFLDLPRNELYSRINARVDQMINDGLEAEARSAYTFRKLNALQTVGYKEFFDFFDGKVTLAKAAELIKQHTRQYAKRQVTWFKKDTEMVVCPPVFDDILKKLDAILNPG